MLIFSSMLNDLILIDEGMNWLIDFYYLNFFSVLKILESIFRLIFNHIKNLLFRFCRVSEIVKFILIRISYLRITRCKKIRAHKFSELEACNFKYQCFWKTPFIQYIVVKYYKICSLFTQLVIIFCVLCNILSLIINYYYF